MKTGILKDTELNTLDGLYAINTTRLRDSICSYDFNTSQVINVYIEKLSDTCTETFWEVKTEDNFLRGNSEQLVYTKKYGFTYMKDLQEGDSLFTFTGEWHPIVGVTCLNLCAPIWSLLVEASDNFFAKGFLIGSANTEVSEMAKTAKKLHSTKKVTSVFKSPLKKIARIYAKHGVVFVESVEGTLKTLDVRTAAMRAQSLNRMPVPAWIRAHRDYLVAQIVEACRAAKYQQETANTGSLTTGVTNVTEGKTWDGKAMPKRPAETVMIENFTVQYPTLKEDEIASLVNEIKRGMPIPDAELIMHEMHFTRLGELQAVKK